jgi:hypothetical protein
MRCSWNELTVEYPASLDLTACPPSVLAVPAVENFAPIGWLSGERFRVPVLDARFAESLARTRRTLAARYAQLSWTGEIAADEVERARLKRPILPLLRPFPRLEAWIEASSVKAADFRERI